MAIQLSGSLAITGSLVATSQIIAQTLNVQQVTSSIVYSSGSNIFGNSLSNTQIMTGSVSITGSLSVNGTSSTLGTGTTNYLPKFTGASTIGNSVISESGTIITVAGSSRFTGFDSGYYNENVLAIGNGTNNPKIGLASTSGYRWNTRIKDVGGNGEYIIRYEEGSLDALIINRSGNLGLGVTPSAWNTNYKAYQVSNNGVIAAASIYNDMLVGSNLFYNAANSPRYMVSDYASMLYQYQGSFIFYTAPSGTAGNAISFTQAMTLDASGRLGIGATSIYGKLHVFSTATSPSLTVGTAAAAIISCAEGQELAITANGTAPYGIAFQGRNNNGGGPSGTSYPIIFNPLGGNVGIGTTSPLAVTNFTTLTINGTNASLIEMQVGGTSYARIQASSSEMSLIARGSTPMVFYTNPGSDTERMRITSGGNVGIGTTSPSYKLDVYSSTTATQAIANFAAANYGSPSSRTIIQIGTQYEDGSSRIVSVNTTGNQSALIFQSHAATSGVWNDAMYITGGGEVGVGTTSPAAKLHIGESGAAAQLWLQRTDGYNPVKLIGGTLSDGNGFKITMNTTDAFAITSGGNVGIGTNDPNIYGNNFTKQVTISNTDSSQYANISMAGGSGASGGIDFGNQTVRHAGVYGLNGSDLGFYTNGSNSGNGLNERMRITSGGNVGIGTTSPQRLLHILAPTGADAYQRIEGGSGGYGGFLELMANTGGSGTDSAGRIDFYMTSANRIATISAQRISAAANYGTLTFSTADNATTPTERMRITSGGNVFINNPSGVSLNGLTNFLSVSSTTYNLFDISRFSDNAFGPNFYFVKSRNGSIGGNTIVASGDNLGNINWLGANGTGFTDAASIKAEVDGSPGASNDMPGRLVFSTTADGAGSVTERMRITSGGTVQPGANGTQDLGTSSLRWATVFTSDLSLSNGIGDYTIVEGEEKLYLYNNKNNKVYSFVLQEEDPKTATPKKS